MSHLSHTVEVRVKGHWVKVPAIQVDGREITASGRWLKIARVRGEEMMENGLESPDIYLASLKNDTEHVLNSDIFTFTQKLPETQPKYPYPMEWESVAAIRLASFQEWWERLPQEGRKNVRRAEKRGVVVKVVGFGQELVEGIRGVNDDSPMRQGMKNAYYGLTSEETSKRYGEFVGRSDFICAYHGYEMIGFLHLVYRGNVAAILNLSSKPSHFDKRPSNALVAKAVEICEARDISYITYGQYNYGNKRDSSLREFKIRNGFIEILVPRYFAPLTLWGRICIKAKFHRGLIGNLPPSVIATGLRARTLWYKKFQMPV